MNCHVTVGLGKPMTEHVRVNGCPSDTTGGFLMTCVTIGGAKIEHNVGYYYISKWYQKKRMIGVIRSGVNTCIIKH